MDFSDCTGPMADVGPHSDQYAVEAILYELLTGKRAFDAIHADQTISGPARLQALKFARDWK